MSVLFHHMHAKTDLCGQQCTMSSLEANLCCGNRYNSTIFGQLKY